MEGYDRARELSAPLLPEPVDDVILDIGAATVNCESDRSAGETTSPFEFLLGSIAATPATTTGTAGFSHSSPLSHPPIPLDPFANRTVRIEGLYEWAKIVVCIPLAIVRLVFFGLALAVGFLATKTALQGWEDKQNPMPRWRCRVMWITRFCSRVILFCFGYHWIRRKGKPAPRELAPIIVCNHVSYIEPIYFFYELFPTTVASESHDGIPFVGTIIRAMQVIYVNRFSAASRKHAVNEIKRKASCDGFPRVLLFPEGTTTNGSALIYFQLGAFIPGYPIQPVAVRYPFVHFDQSWGNISLTKLMFRMFTQFHNFMEVEYLPVISPLENKKESPIHFAARTSHAIASALNVVQTFHSYGDLLLLLKASEQGYEKASAFMVEVARFDHLFSINTLEVVEFLERFMEMKPDCSGRVQMYNFLNSLRLKHSPLTEKVFAFLDVEQRGSITFRQFLYGSACILRQPAFRPACEVIFDNYDHNGEGYISEPQFGNALRCGDPYLSEKNVHELYALFDVDKDGVVGSNDFMICLQKNPVLIGLFPSCTRIETV
ncbi:lysophospholipid acyltransferase LPEAT2 [Nymphaea colorata]|nr:lysophospholipid acyltransferase LPEAT2 [Nymphaea colorata]